MSETVCLSYRVFLMFSHKVSMTVASYFLHYYIKLGVTGLISSLSLSFISIATKCHLIKKTHTITMLKELENWTQDYQDLN